MLFYHILDFQLLQLFLVYFEVYILVINQLIDILELLLFFIKISLFFYIFMVDNFYEKDYSIYYFYY